MTAWPGPSLDNQRIAIPATTLAEFLARAVANHGSIRCAADGIGIPYSILRAWLRGRCGDAGDHGNTFLMAVTALREDLNAMSQPLEVLEKMLGCESDTRVQD